VAPEYVAKQYKIIGKASGDNPEIHTFTAQKPNDQPGTCTTCPIRLNGFNNTQDNNKLLNIAETRIHLKKRGVIRKAR
jgi:hypothetical protein